MNVLIIEKNENIIEKNVKTFDVDKIYSLCGYRSNKDFQKLYQWVFDKHTYEVYGKTTGKADNENKYKFPINDTENKKEKLEKHYGNLCIIKKNSSITLDEWNIFYMSFTSKDDKNINIMNVDDIHDNDDEIDSNHEYDLKDPYNKYILDELTYEEYEEE
jgi:hypothetical protein